MDYRVLFAISSVFFMSVAGDNDYAVALLYPRNNGVMFRFDSQGRNTHIKQDEETVPETIQTPLEPRIDQGTSKDEKFVPKVDLSKCQGETFCEDADYYPYHEVDYKLSEAGEAEYKYIFGIDDVQLTNKMDSSKFYTPGKDGMEGVSRVVFHSICETKMRIIFPRVAKNRKNQWKYVVNQDVEKVQGIAVEWCTNSGERCQYLSSRNKLMVPTCGQKYSYRRLLTLSHDGNLESDIFEFPVACMCYLKTFIFV